MEYTHTMLATLGGQPQVVTFTLDLLLERGFPISEAIIIRPDALEPRLQHSLACLNAEFVGDRYCGRVCRLRSHVLQLNDTPLADITDDISANGALDTVHQLIRDLKQHNRILHLSISGGRRLMALMAISAAPLSFGHADYIWHIYTPLAVRERASEGKLMHVSPEDGVNLIRVPFVPWGAYFPNLLQLADSNAQAVMHTQMAEMDALEHARCDEVVRKATPKQLETLRAFAREMSPQEVADYLGRSIKTVDTHKTALLGLCYNAWNKKPNTLDYHFLQTAFARYFPGNE